MTGTRVDQHHCSLNHAAREAAEGHLSGGGLLRSAAARVGALTTVFQAVSARAIAAVVNETDGPRCCVALLALPLLSPLKQTGLLATVTLYDEEAPQQQPRQFNNQPQGV